MNSGALSNHTAVASSRHGNAAPLVMVVAALLLSLTCLASAQDPLTYDLAIFRVEPTGELIPATEAAPGEVVEYQITVQNVSDTALPGHLVQIRLPVPEGTTYIPGSGTTTLEVLLEFSTDGAGFDTMETAGASELRWTFLEPLEPGHSSTLHYRVSVDVHPPSTDSARAPPEATLPPGHDYSAQPAIEAFTQAMFGHLGIVQIRCPTRFDDAETSYYCGETSQAFDRFMRSWDLYADWESRIPFLPEPLTAWRQEDVGYSRTYRMHGKVFMVFYFNGLVLIGY